MSLWKQPPQVQGTRQPKGCWARSALLADWRWPGLVLSDPYHSPRTISAPPPQPKAVNSAQKRGTKPLGSPRTPQPVPRPGPEAQVLESGGPADRACGLHEQQLQAVSSRSWLPAALQEGPGARGREEPSGQGSKGLLLLVCPPPPPNF